MVRFTPLPAAEFDEYLTMTIGVYTRMLADGGLDVHQARRRAETEFNTLLPQGVATPNNYIMGILDAKSNIRVGHIWILASGEGLARFAYLCDLIVLPDYQGRGYGTAALRQIDDFVRELCLPFIKLHVLGNNPRAVSFYERAGYRVTELFMQRDLPASPSVTAGSITHGPLGL
jgi:ribosomal protein S18 acetylase RimI-like enzyme